MEKGKTPGEECVIALETAGYEYPAGYCNPSEPYPEYPWDKTDISKEQNQVYAAVRRCLFDLGMDRDNYGTPHWNPLKNIIQKGNTVLLKPNLVVSDHPNLDCIVTNPSIVRAVMDFVYIALGGTGKIIIGDAPMQRCNFNELIEKTGYDKLTGFYSRKGVDVELVDFRNFISDYSAEDVKILKDVQKGSHNFISVDLGTESLHCPRDKYYKRYRVTNYDYRKMQNYHNPGHHIYLIRKELLEADAVINLPKPKTHRKAGYTGALKNMVGTVVHKECLPHHIKGSVMAGGDEYLHRDLFKSFRTFCYEKMDLANIYHKTFMLPLLKSLLKVLERAVRKYQKDPFSEGSWYGNDTIWRTFGDINRCLLYADRQGKLHDKNQRNFLTIADMVISGEKEGPVHALPKKVGKVAAGENPVLLDYLIVKMMGFDDTKIPALAGLIKNMRYPLLKGKKETIKVNSSEWTGQKKLDELSFPFNFLPSSGWKGSIEMEKVK